MVSARLARGLALTAATLLWSSAALSGEPEPTDPQTVDAARFDFTEGTAHFQAKRWAEALKAFEHSFSLVPSPNTELMIARCLRELGRRVDAANVYASAAAEAHRRAMAGEGKYKQTADVAAAEGAAVRLQLGTIHVHVTRPADATLTVDKKVVELSKDGDATILHEPGTASVTVSDATGAEQRQTVTVQPNTTVQMDFSVQGAAPTQVPERTPLPPAPPAPAPQSGPSWPVPAALISGGVALAGLGVFIGFGASSQSTYDALAARCGPASCGPGDREEADSGERSQTIANVGIGVSAVAAVATIVFVAVALTSGDRALARAPRLFDPGRPGPL